MKRILEGISKIDKGFLDQEVSKFMTQTEGQIEELHLMIDIGSKSSMICIRRKPWLDL